MFDVGKSKAVIRDRLKGRIERLDFTHVGRWLPMTALLVIAGCSWFDEEPTPPTPSEQSADGQAKATPAPGEGETMGDDQEAKVPDINSVPNEAPKSTIVDLDQAQEGLGSDSSNSQHTDETLTMPNETAARPEKPAGEPQTAEVQPVAPETQEAVTTTEPPTPAPAPAPVATSEPMPVPEPVQVATTGTPQSGSKPFEPNGPLNLTPGSLDRSPGEAAAAPTGIAAAPLSGSGTATLTAPTMGAGTPSQDGVSVDYSALNGLQSSGATSYQQSAGAQPVRGYAPTGSIAGVGQAVGYVYFGNGSSRLSAADRQVLQQVAQLQRFQGGVLRIIGHASARTGNMEALDQQELNRQVSLERATAVARALVEYGVQPILVQVAAAGDDQTLYAESTPAGEAGNRRAEVYLSQN